MEGKRDAKHRVNAEISANTVRVIDSAGETIGVMDLRSALKRAAAEGLDLVEVSSASHPPVCKILDYGKLKYDLQKKKSEAKKKQKIIEVKEIKLTPVIADHDLHVKIVNIKKFLASGHKVKVSLRFRGREMTHQEIGRAVLDKVLANTEDCAKLEAPIKLEGNHMLMILVAASGSK